MYDQLMQFVFDWCVGFLVWWANAWGITYEELNVYLSLSLLEEGQILSFNSFIVGVVFRYSLRSLVKVIV